MNEPIPANSEEDSPGLKPPVAEAILIDAVDQLPPGDLLCTSAGVGQFVRAAMKRKPRFVHCHWFDQYRDDLAITAFIDDPPYDHADSRCVFSCQADFPDRTFQSVALPLSATGDNELTREMLQQAHQRLAVGGKLFASTDSPRDTWLGEQIEKVFGAVEKFPQEHGVLYIAAKTGPLKKVKDYACQFAFRDGGKLIHAVSRPGVFAHRRLDVGARKLIDGMEISAGDRVIDIGCGCGSVGFAAAMRAENVSVYAIDSFVRSVECARAGAKLNGLSNYEASINAHGLDEDSELRGTFDVALANPPYYANFRIARHFLQVASDALKPGGKIFLVTKSPQWYETNMPAWFEGISAREAKGYFVFKGVKP